MGIEIFKLKSFFKKKQELIKKNNIKNVNKGLQNP